MLADERMDPETQYARARLGNGEVLLVHSFASVDRFVQKSGDFAIGDGVPHRSFDEAAAAGRQHALSRAVHQ